MDDDDSYGEDECEFDDYNDYYEDDDMDIASDVEPISKYCEDASFESLAGYEVERMLNDNVALLAEKSGIGNSLARILLHAFQWDLDKVLAKLHNDRERTFIDARINPSKRPHYEKSTYCDVCASESSQMESLPCKHEFCRNCWRSHFEARLSEGVATRIECMDSDCKLLCSTDFVINILEKRPLIDKYERFIFRDFVNSHPELKFCVGKDCQAVIKSNEKQAKRVCCTKCNTSFCVICGVDYHAPTSCETIRLWLVKCADDSETANYISAHTKDCPRCHTCIEKNGGCNHMQCAKCKHHFCWMCFGDWKTHGSEYYECSRYKDNPSVAAEANHVKARRALEKYLHYFERFENHSKSLKLEQQLREKIRKKIENRVNEHDGTWIDWQYLLNAVSLLTKCRYTLQYTYPFAYYMESGAQKHLFEYQQAQLEKEVEELAWAVERADATARGALEAHMHRAEHKRITLLQSFSHATS